ncbi:MAG: phosphatase PAP2 family protein [Rhodanobacteraceae bacterium]
MDRRLLLWTAAISALLVAAGLLFLDRPIAEFVRAAGIEQARVFAIGIAALDAITALSVWIWGIGCVALAAGLVGLALRRDDRWPRALIAAAVVQFASLETMILGKETFGRVRPHQVLESGDWSHVWFAGGSSFPSGHSAFYFGLLLPLAAACPIRWLRIVLIAIPVYVVLARLDLHKHFLSDVSASALVAAIYSLIVATLIRRWLPAPARA